MIFKTTRLIIRKLRLSDIDNFHDMQSNPNVMKYIKDPMNLSESKRELKRFMAYYDDPSTFFKIWAIEQKNKKSFVGICGVYTNENKEYEIAYRLRESSWRKGYGKEIAKNLIKYCFEDLKIEKLTADVISKNIGSVRILEDEMNFVEESFCKELCEKERIYELSKSEWENTN